MVRYRVPLMSELPEPVGPTLVSTFSGCGGSSLGFRMAGYRVLWASEFVPAAAEVYKLNSQAGTVLDTRDVREVTGADILKACGVDEVDVMEGSPPCASFSTAGKRQREWGKKRKYSDVAQRVDDLFFEYARLIGEVRPKVFVAENVKGLITGKAKGYFLDILGALQASGYRVQARLIDASWLGVPQARERVIFVGVRDDLPGEPVFPTPQKERVTLSQALDPPPPLIDTADDRVNHGLKLSPCQVEEWLKLPYGGKSTKYFNLRREHPHRPATTIVAVYGTGAAAASHPDEPRKFSIPELKRLCSFPDDFVLTGTYSRQCERLGRSVPPVMMMNIARTIRKQLLC